MRYWLSALMVALLVVGTTDSQDKKKDKDKPKEVKEISEYAGKTFEMWRKELHQTDPAEREVAFRAIVMFPLDKVYKALPDILQELNKHKTVTVDLSVRVNGVIAVGKIMQAKFMPDPKTMETIQAMEKPDPKVVESLLAKSRPDPKLVKDAVAIFRLFLKDDQIILKVRAAQYLPYLGPDARDALPEIIKLCKDPSSWEVRKEALICLAFLSFTDKGPDQKMLPEFVKGLEDSSAQVRMTAATALGRLGGGMKDKANPFIINKLNKPAEGDKDHRVRIQAHMAIMATNQEWSKKHIGAIMGYLQDIDPRTRLDVVQSLAMTGEQGKKMMPAMVPTLLSTIRDPQSEVALAAIVALVHIRADEAKPMLLKISDSKEDEPQWLREACEDAVGQMKLIAENEKKMKDLMDKAAKDKKVEKK